MSTSQPQHTKFSLIYNQYKNWIYVSTKKLVPKDEDFRKDVEQLLWLRVWKYIDTLDTKYKLTPILLLMTRQVFLTEQKKLDNKNKRFLRLENFTSNVYSNYEGMHYNLPRMKRPYKGDNISLFCEDIREDLEYAFEFDRLLTVINTKIKEKFRKAALLKWVYGYGEKDLMKELNIPYPKVKSILAMAKKDIVKYYCN